MLWAVPVVIRTALPEDGPALRAIERLAGERYREFGLAAIADSEPSSVERLSSYATAGRSWVVVDAAGSPVGFVLADQVDGNAHVEQVSVTPAAQGLGLGRALISQVQRWALESGMRTVTLTTFADVPWNGPLYEHLGFRVLASSEVGPELRTIRDAEAAHGLDVARRVCMYIDLPESATSTIR
jgi:GNAT superfamily N-acetyltransferase